MALNIWCGSLSVCKATALWSLQIVCCVLPQEISRNFKGIWDSATLKRFYSPFLQSQFYIKKKKTKLWLIIRRYFIQLTISLHNVLKKELFQKPIYRHQILIGGRHPISPINPLNRLLLADHWAMLLPKQIRACRTWVPRHFTRYNAATPPPAASARAVTCRRRRKSPLDGARDLLSQIGQHITTVSFV